MNPHTGEVFELPAGFAAEVPVGTTLSREEIQTEMARLMEEAARRSLPILQQEALTLVTPEVAQRMKLGAREQERRRKRRKAGKDSRRRNR